MRFATVTAAAAKNNKLSSFYQSVYNKMFRIILLGDSITQMSFSSPGGFGAHLADVYQRRADVLNRGYSGYNTNWILELLSTEEDRGIVFGGPSQPTTNSFQAEFRREDNSATANSISATTDSTPTISTPLPSNAVRLIVLFLGANDASCPVLNARQHVPLETYQKNLISIVQISKQHCPYAKFILVAPPPIHHDGRLKYQIERYGPDNATGELERTLELSGNYAAAAQNMAQELEIPAFLNLWQEMQDVNPTSWHEYLSDGLHLSPSGNEFVGTRLVELITQYYPELAVHPCDLTGLYGNSNAKSDLAQHGPWHDKIEDPLNYNHWFRNCPENLN